MADIKYYSLSEEAITKLCGLIRDSHSVSEGIDDANIATNSTYSSKKIEELLGDAGITAVEITKEEYDALTEEEKNGETIYFVKDEETLPNGVSVVTELTDDATDSQVPSAKAVYGEMEKLNYSTEEHIVGKWIDGKTLYEITLVFDSPAVTTAGEAVTDEHDISSLGMTMGFVESAVFNRQGSNGARNAWYQLPHRNSSGHGIAVSPIRLGSNTIDVWADDNNFKYGGSVYITIRYTKD